MIVIAGEVRIRPETRDEAARAAMRMVEATRAEQGCESYRFSSDLADPNLIYIFEAWQSEEALAKHFATPHMAEFRAAMPRFLAALPSLMRYEVSSAAPM